MPSFCISRLRSSVALYMGRSGAAAFTLSCSILASIGGDVGFGGGQLRALRVNLGHDLLLIELRQLLALVDAVVDVDIELFHDAGGLDLDFDLGDGLDFAGGDHGARHIAARHFGQPVGIDLRALRPGAPP